MKRRSVLERGPSRAVVVALTLLLFCIDASPRQRGTSAPAAGRSGTFTFLTYNVAGLPGLLSKSDPEANTPVISRLLNLYDVVVVQEDFAYHDTLSRDARHGFRSVAMTPNERVGIGDGLNRFSTIRFSRLARQEWKACNGRFSHGADCFTAKGFTVGEHELAPGVLVDVYNVHMDSGRSREDDRARRAQVDQLLAFMNRRSRGRPVIVAGDTNLGHESEPLLKKLLSHGSLTDACRALACRRPHGIDRVMYRSSSDVELRAEVIRFDARFARPDGSGLSDHEAVGVVFRWAARRATKARRFPFRRRP